ncbi:GNAT family N-acetyltransferase [Streptomyces sp. NPDC090798]|uniref:GNAT family N-acetyltransferase n=1 Tax=Streptomyces sp. NPDC090798 TaxID=3365968 RepID=UPI00381D6E23
MVLPDCERVAEIRIRGRRTAYRGLMPRSYLDALSVAEDAARRRERFGRGGGAIVNLVAERVGAGVGRALLMESTARCTAAGHERMLLWVLKENTGARRFYEQAGFGPDGGEEPFEVDSVAVPEVRYARTLTCPGAEGRR